MENKLQDLTKCKSCGEDLCGSKNQLDFTCKTCKAYKPKEENTENTEWDRVSWKNWYEFDIKDNYNLIKILCSCTYPSTIKRYHSRFNEYIRTRDYNSGISKYDVTISCKNNGDKKFIRAILKLGDYYKMTLDLHKKEVIYNYKVYEYNFSSREYDLDFFFPDGFYLSERDSHSEKIEISDTFLEVKSICEEFISNKYIPLVKG